MFLFAAFPFIQPFLDLLAPCLLGSGQVKQGQSPIHTWLVTPCNNDWIWMLTNRWVILTYSYTPSVAVAGVLLCGDFTMHVLFISIPTSTWCIQITIPNIFGGVPQSPSSSCFLVTSISHLSLREVIPVLLINALPFGLGTLGEVLHGNQRDDTSQQLTRDHYFNFRWYSKQWGVTMGQGPTWGWQLVSPWRNGNSVGDLSASEMLLTFLEAGRLSPPLNISGDIPQLLRLFGHLLRDAGL